MADPSHSPPFHVKGVETKDDLLSLIDKLPDYFWWSMLVVKMRWRESYSRLENVEGQLNDWTHTVNDLFEDLTTESCEVTTYEHCIVDFLLRVASSVGYLDKDAENFAIKIMRLHKEKFNDLFMWVAECLKKTQTAYLHELREEDCTLDTFEKAMQNEVEILSKKSLHGTPLEAINAQIFLAIVERYTASEEQKEKVRKHVEI